MKNNQVETLVKDGNVYVKMEDLLNGLYGVVNKWQLLYNRETHGTERDASFTLSGMVSLCQGMETLHEEWKRREGLT